MKSKTKKRSARNPPRIHVQQTEWGVARAMTLVMSEGEGNPTSLVQVQEAQFEPFTYCAIKFVMQQPTADFSKIPDHEHGVIPLRSLSFDRAALELVKKFPKAKATGVTFFRRMRVIKGRPFAVAVSEHPQSTVGNRMVQAMAISFDAEHLRAKTGAERAEKILDQHAHIIIGTYPTMVEAMRACDRWKSPAKIEACECEEAAE